MNKITSIKSHTVILFILCHTQITQCKIAHLSFLKIDFRVLY